MHITKVIETDGRGQTVCAERKKNAAAEEVVVFWGGPREGLGEEFFMFFSFSRRGGETGSPNFFVRCLVVCVCV